MSDPAAATTVDVRSYDLIPKLIPHLDRHLIFPLIEFLEPHLRDNGVSPQEIAQCKFNLFKDSNMTDFVVELYKEIHDTDQVPANLLRKQEVLEKLHSLEDQCQLLLQVLGTEGVVQNLRQDKTQNMQYLKENHNVWTFPLSFGGGIERGWGVGADLGS